MVASADKNSLFLWLVRCWPHLSPSENFPIIPWNFWVFNPFPSKPWYLRVYNKSFENTAEKGEIARNELFLLFQQCFLPISITFCHFHQIWNCHLQSLSVWACLKFVVWERVKQSVKPWWLLASDRPGHCWPCDRLWQNLYTSQMFLTLYRPFLSVNYQRFVVEILLGPFNALQVPGQVLADGMLYPGVPID